MKTNPQHEPRIRAVTSPVELIHRCSAVLAAFQESGSSLREVCQVLVDRAGARSAWVHVAAQTELPLRCAAHAGEPDDCVAIAHLIAASGSLFWRTRSRAAGLQYCSVRPAAGMQFDSILPRADERPDHCLLVPIRWEARALGVLHIHAHQGQPFESEAEAAFRVLADLIALDQGATWARENALREDRPSGVQASTDSGKPDDRLPNTRRDGEAPQDGPRGHKKHPLTVLLVDDDEHVRVIAARFLEDSGCKVLVAEDGPTALRIWGKSAADIDAVVTDLLMPEMTGAELVEQLKKKRPRLAAVFMSGFPSSTAFGFGLDRSIPFLQKPFTADDLIAIVADTVKSAAPNAST